MVEPFKVSLAEPDNADAVNDDDDADDDAKKQFLTISGSRLNHIHFWNDLVYQQLFLEAAVHLLLLSLLYLCKAISFILF